MINDQFLIIFIDETELLEEVIIDDRIIRKILKKLLYLNDKSVIINFDCIRTINLNQ